MNFEWALDQLREGRKVRSGRTPAIWLENGEFWYETKHGIFNYMTLTSNEILAEDWELDHLYDRHYGYKSYMFRKVNECLDFSDTTPHTRTRIENCLKNLDIIFMGELLSKEERELLELPNFGRKGLKVILNKLHALELHMGMGFSEGEWEKLQRLKENCK